LGQIIFGLAAMMISGIIILGSLSFTFLENKSAIALVRESTNTLQVTAIRITVVPGEPTYTSIPPTPTPTIPPPLSCPPPAGWSAYDVQPDDSVASLADLLGYPVEIIAEGNCLLPASAIQQGMILYLPNPASPTPLSDSPTPAVQSGTAQTSKRTVNPPFQCGRPAGWTTYVIRHGDTLYNIAQRYYTTVDQLQRANCLSSTVIRVGRIIYVPNRATRTPYPTMTARPTYTLSPVAPTTQIPITMTAVPPTTIAPTTLAPTTAIPTTAIPTTLMPTTVVPTTIAPTEPPPTTVAPTSPPPTTSTPTEIPTTVAPTQPPPTTAPPPPPSETPPPTDP